MQVLTLQHWYTLSYAGCSAIVFNYDANLVRGSITRYYTGTIVCCHSREHANFVSYRPLGAHEYYKPSTFITPATRCCSGSFMARSVDKIGHRANQTVTASTSLSHQLTGPCLGLERELVKISLIERKRREWNRLEWNHFRALGSLCLIKIQTENFPWSWPTNKHWLLFFFFLSSMVNSKMD